MKTGCIVEKFRRFLIAGVVLSLTLTGCGGTESTTNGNADLEEDNVNIAEETVIEGNELVTEEDYRNAIKIYDNSDLTGKVELYKAFSTVYQLTEDEYIEYASICGETGDTNAQRDILHKLYRLDPTKEHGEMMSAVPYTITDEENESVNSLQNLADILDGASSEGFSINAVSDFVATDAWKNTFYIDNGTFSSHTICEGNSIAGDITSDRILTKGIIKRNGKQMIFETSAIGSTISQCELSENNLEGNFSIFEYDSDGSLSVAKNGTIKDGHCVGDIYINLGGIEYKGSFDDDGLTKEAQVEGVDGAIFAYDEGHRNYLYATGEDSKIWRADLEYIGIINN